MTIKSTDKIMTVTEFTFQQAENLIATPKVILESDGKSICNFKQIDCAPGLRENITLQSTDEEFLFLWTIHRSAKESFKLSLNVLEKDSHIGIFRVDYVSESSIHPNPIIATEDVPDKLKAFAGKEIFGPHAHFNVSGYKTLQWAIPLKDTDFGVKSIVDEQNHIDIASAINCFAKYINITTPILAQPNLI